MNIIQPIPENAHIGQATLITKTDKNIISQNRMRPAEAFRIKKRRRIHKRWLSGHIGKNAPKSTQNAKRTLLFDGLF